jgi:hypothetical protein
LILETNFHLNNSALVQTSTDLNIGKTNPALAEGMINTVEVKKQYFLSCFAEKNEYTRIPSIAYCVQKS